MIRRMRSERKPRESLGAAEARRVALAAQGLAAGRRDRPARRGDLARVAQALGTVQIDSVNVLVRSHYLPFYSRLGAYDPAWLDELAYGRRRRRLFEYWGHEASLMPVGTQPLLRWRMQRARDGVGVWGGVARFGREQQAFCTQVLREIEARGPLGVSELAAAGKRKGGWWGWSEGKVALEWLFWTGQVTTHSRRRFERIYDLTERVLPAAVGDAPTPAPEDAQRDLLRQSLRPMGVATARDLRDYFRLPLADTRLRIAELVDAGEWRVVRVEGWRDPAYVAADVRVPRRVEACALLSPFDSLVWCRERTQRLFDFHYRLEIYTPAHKRRHGYYVLPFLLGDRLAARVDLKADRAAGRLRVLSRHYEPWVDRRQVAPELTAELARLAAWLGLR
jgi:uncharacterized protein YcaQ